LRGRILFLIRYNWGFIFVLVFILLVISSGIALSLGEPDTSNVLANFGFYSLGVGVILEIVSYAIYGIKPFVEPTNIPSFPTVAVFSHRLKLIAATVISILVVGAIYASYSYHPTSTIPGNTPGSGPSFSQTTTQSTRTIFGASTFFTRVFPEPENQTLISFGILASGGVPPYLYSTVWSDGFVQSNNVGTFSRTIQQGEAVPTSATVTVTGANGKNVTVVVEVPPENITTSTTTNQINHSVIFLEQGLAKNLTWSVQLNGTLISSKNGSVIFPTIKNGDYHFVVSYKYNGSLNSVFNYTPRAGVITLNGTNKIENVTFSLIPIGQLEIPQSKPAESYSNGTVALDVSYKNNLPVPLEATIVAVVNRSSGSLATVSTAKISLNAGSVSQTVDYIAGLASGNYSAVVYVLSLTGEVISPKSYISFIVPSS
jgi:hypothetical protein